MLTNEELDRLARLGVELKQLEKVGADECDLGEQRRVAAKQRFKGKLLQYGERLISQAREANALRDEVRRLREAEAYHEASMCSVSDIVNCTNNAGTKYSDIKRVVMDWRRNRCNTTSFTAAKEQS